MANQIILTPKEAYRFEVVSNVLKRKITNQQASSALQRSIRQVRRIKVAVRFLGMQGVIHKLKGKPSNHRKQIVDTHRG